jgi:hypothetical protein
MLASARMWAQEGAGRTGDTPRGSPMHGTTGLTTGEGTPWRIGVALVPGGHAHPAGHAPLQLRLTAPGSPHLPASHAPEQNPNRTLGRAPKRPAGQRTHCPEPIRLKDPRGHSSPGVAPRTLPAGQAKPPAHSPEHPTAAGGCTHVPPPKRPTGHGWQTLPGPGPPTLNQPAGQGWPLTLDPAGQPLPGAGEHGEHVVMTPPLREYCPAGHKAPATSTEPGGQYRPGAFWHEAVQDWLASPGALPKRPLLQSAQGCGPPGPHLPLGHGVPLLLVAPGPQLHPWGGASPEPGTPHRPGHSAWAVRLLKRPGGHSLHPGLAPPTLKRPGPQGAPPGWVLPGGQAHPGAAAHSPLHPGEVRPQSPPHVPAGHKGHRYSPPPLYVPAGHVAMVCIVVAPAGHSYPAGQGPLQPSEDSPVLAATVPGGQGWHASMLDAMRPTTELNRPSAHGVQGTRPEVLHWPRGHAWFSRAVVGNPPPLTTTSTTPLPLQMVGRETVPPQDCLRSDPASVNT